MLNKTIKLMHIMSTAEEYLRVMTPDGQILCDLMFFADSSGGGSVDVNWNQSQFKGEAFAIKDGRDLLRKEIDNSGQLITVLTPRTLK